MRVYEEISVEPGEHEEQPPQSPQHKLTRRHILRRAALGAGGMVMAGGGSLAYAHNIEPGWLDVTQVQAPLPRLAPAFHGYRIAQISDIHMDHWMTPARLAEIVQVVNAQKPDLIALTGDYVTHNAPHYAPYLVTAFSMLQARDVVVATLGNHDHWTNAGIVHAVLQAAGVADLSNTAYTLTRDGQHLHIAGVDDVWEQKARLDLVLAAIPGDDAALLLAHEPDFADASAATGRFDLQISGHSHGGQIALPFYGPVGRVPYGNKYPSGRYRVGRMLHYTNRGVGMIKPHLRFYCRPEITIFTLVR